MSSTSRQPQQNSTDREAEIARLSEALNTHQLELKMQQDELDRTSAELDKALRKFDEMRENAPVAYLIHDEMGYVFEINKRGRDLLGLQPCEKNLRLGEILGSKTMELIQFNLKRIQAIQGPASIEFRLDRPNVAERYVLAEMSRVERCVFRMVLVDVTRRKATERVEQQLDSKLLHVQKMEILDRLSGGIAHDFNNILQVLLLQSEIVKACADPNDQSVVNGIDQICKTTERGIEMTSRLLAFSRKMPLEKTRVDLNDVIDKCMDLVRRSKAGQCTLVVELATEKLGVCGDVVQLEQAVMNLCLNARDAMPTGGELRVTTSRVFIEEQTKKSQLTLFPGSYAKISVADQGTGIDADKISRIFEPYFTTKDVGKGTGLGLSIVHAILRQHHGAIEVVKSDSGGSQFDLYLPSFHLPHERRSPPKSVNRDDLSMEGVVLVCEDEPTILKVVANSLETFGLKVIRAEMGRSAIAAIAESEHVDLLLSDVVLPDVDGREVSRIFRAKYPNSSIVFMSGHGDSVLDQKFLRQINATFLAKPFRFENLREKLGVHLLQNI